MSSIEDRAIDLVLTHPPYMNIIRYSEGKIAGHFRGSQRVVFIMISWEGRFPQWPSQYIMLAVS